jgi:hypothetical protein
MSLHACRHSSILTGIMNVSYGATRPPTGCGRMPTWQQSTHTGRLANAAVAVLDMRALLERDGHEPQGHLSMVCA